MRPGKRAPRTLCKDMLGLEYEACAQASDHLIPELVRFPFWNAMVI